MKKEGEREIKKAGGREGEGGVKIKKLKSERKDTQPLCEQLFIIVLSYYP